MLLRLVYTDTMNIEQSFVWECAISGNPGIFPPGFVMIGRNTAAGTEIEHWQLKGTW